METLAEIVSSLVSLALYEECLPVEILAEVFPHIPDHSFVQDVAAEGPLILNLRVRFTCVRDVEVLISELVFALAHLKETVPFLSFLFAEFRWTPMDILSQQEDLTSGDIHLFCVCFLRVFAYFLSRQHRKVMVAGGLFTRNESLIFWAHTSLLDLISLGD